MRQILRHLSGDSCGTPNASDRTGDDLQRLLAHLVSARLFCDVLTFLERHIDNLRIVRPRLAILVCTVYGYGPRATSNRHYGLCRDHPGCRPGCGVSLHDMVFQQKLMSPVRKSALRKVGVWCVVGLTLASSSSHRNEDWRSHRNHCICRGARIDTTEVGAI